MHEFVAQKTYLMRVEIRVEDDHSVGSPEIDTDTTGAGTQDVDEDVRIRLVELVHILLSVRLLGVSVLQTL